MQTQLIIVGLTTILWIGLGNSLPQNAPDTNITAIANYTELYISVFGGQSNANETPPAPKVTELYANVSEPIACVVNNKGGECTHYYLCSNDSNILTDGSGKLVLDLRFGGECPLLQPCCALKSAKPIVPPVSIATSCGVRNPKGLGFRIFNETDRQAQEAEFPWSVALLKKKELLTSSNQSQFQCGGSLIHSLVVVSVAHCVSTKEPNTLIARAGEWDSITTDEYYKHQDRDVADILVHPEYNPANVFNDIALLWLRSPFNIAENVNTVCLPPQNFNFDNNECIASGWGQKTWEEPLYNSILKRIDLPVVPKNKCQELLRTTRLGIHFELHESFICAGGGEADTCTGDGGSPLMCPIPEAENQYFQAGVVAWGIGCKGVHPGVYVNVALFRNWIDDQMRERTLNPASYIFQLHDLRVDLKNASP